MHCAICKADFDKSHPWKIHRIKLETYLHQYIPRYNLLTGHLVKFKSLDQYLTTDFDAKTEFVAWHKDKSEQIVFNYLLDYLNRRKEYKHITVFPGQFESRSLCFPSISYIIKLWGAPFLEQLSIQSKLPLSYNYVPNIEYEVTSSPILIDTREQLPLFKGSSNIEIVKLDEGDYQLKKQNQNIIIDRKSLNDCIGTMSQGYERFERELDRAKEKGKYLVMMVESKYSNLNSFNYLPAMRRIKATPDFIFHRIRELLNKYSNFQVVCVDGRQQAENFVIKTLSLKTNIEKIDLQYCIDTGII